MSTETDASIIIDNGYNMTLSGLGLIEAETVEHAEPEEILVSVAAKEERILGLIGEMQELPVNCTGNMPTSRMFASTIMSKRINLSSFECGINAGGVTGPWDIRSVRVPSTNP